MQTAELKIQVVREIADLPDEAFQKLYPELLRLLHPTKQREIGSLKGIIGYMADDFDAPLDAFNEYAP